MNRRLIAATIAITVIGAACSGSSTTTSSADGATGTTGTTTAAGVSDTTATTSTAAPTTVTTEAMVDGDLRALTGLGPVGLVDPAPVGVQPTLAWEPVDGAEHYRVVVLDGSGDPYWAWLGTDTSVPFGGADSGEGLLASVHEPMTWTVIAVAADGRTIAISDQGNLPGG